MAVVVALATFAGPLAAADVPDTPTGGPARATAADRSGVAPTVGYRPPAPVEVRRPFEPPSTAFGPGHRGVDLAAAAGDPIVVAGPGTVRHAGPVAGVVWVSVGHADGIVTSYGPLTGLAVGPGDAVAAGEVLGRLAAGGHGDGGVDTGLHWGARRGQTYLDPLSLLDGGVPRPSLLGPGGWDGTAHAVEPYPPWRGGRLGGLGVAPSPVADRPGYAVPPGPNHLVVLAGLATSSDDGLRVDPAHLGYDPASVTAFSYAGRRSGDDGDPADPWRDQRPYGPADTWAGVEAASARLRDQLRAQAAREPGRAVDLLGHSMGGVVALHYLVNHHDPYDPSLPPIGHVVTVAAPHAGSDLAELAASLRDHRLGPLVELARRGAEHLGLATAGDLSLLAPAVEQLRPGSALLDDVAAGWAAALAADTAGALATGTRVLTIGAAGDVIVPAHRSGVADDGRPTGLGLPRVEHQVLPGDHSGVVETEALREVVWRFLAGEEVVASPGVAATWLSRAHGGSLRALGGLLRVEDRIGRWP